MSFKIWKKINFLKFLKKIFIFPRYPKLPCLDLGKDNKTPMELCKTVTTNKTALSSKEQADMVRATARPAQERQNNIIQLFNQCKVGTDPILRVNELYI